MPNGDRSLSDYFDRKQIGNRLRFFNDFLRSPRQIGALAPSSRYLARQMVEPIDWASVRSVAELGAGTGVFTSALAEQVQPGTTVLVFEKDREMHEDLKERFPQFHHRTEAISLLKAIRECGIDRLDAIISGLPFTVFTPELRDLVLNEITMALRPGGLFVAFQYTLAMYPTFHRRFESVNLSFVTLNLPPAIVYACRKSGG